ncbi:HAMP domain-containing histidine kinase [Ornithinibacillus gellani]|uniref:sensor histidine kinase n=1 Tax=Ornithinibacillus gellani TaxID=2293253 RepID=UPI000F4A5E82|nr:ATP-binding protein [Ornithinibacillus gellani]TQS72234.1 HAMP domain-containing histidine kinase [Ornithinibacillus gellani]
MFNKLSLKIGLLFFVFIVIIEAFLFFILYTNLVNDRIDEIMNNLLARANTHRDVLEDDFTPSTLEHVGVMESASDFAVIVTDAAGKIMIASDPVESEMKDVIRHNDYKNIPTMGKIIEDRWDEKKYIVADSPITIEGAHQGHVFMFAHTNIVKNTVDHLSNQFFLVGQMTVLLTIITIFILSRFITLPLIKMKEATEQLSKGKTKVDLSTDRRDELGELARSIMSLSSDLERLKKDRNEFLASISHELRTPLTYIKGYADLISKRDFSDEEQKEYLYIIQEETERVTVLVKNLFDLAKMDENTFVIYPENIQLSQLIHSIEERMRPVIEQKNIRFVVSCPENLDVKLDPKRMQQVLINVLDNASKHTREGKKIALEVSQTDTDVVITVSDEGEGIPDADLPYIFDRLYRVEKSRSRESGGTGIGLAIAKEIIEAHGGTIAIRSELAKGTTVIISLRRGHIDEESAISRR